VIFIAGSLAASIDFVNTRLRGLRLPKFQIEREEKLRYAADARAEYWQAHTRQSVKERAENAS